MIFENDVLQHIATEEGRVRPNGSGGVVYDYFLKDHLGNTRMLLQENGALLEETHYYPFGLTQKGISYTNPIPSLQNKDKTFQGQKFDDDLGLNYYSFKYRNHDPQIGRFIEIDPLANDYVYNSPYAFSENAVTGDVELEGLERVSARYMDPYYYAQQRRSYQQVNSYVPNASSYRRTSTYTSNAYNTATTDADIYVPRTSSTDPTITKGNLRGEAATYTLQTLDAVYDQVKSIKVTTDNIHSKNLAGGEEFSSKVSGVEITFNSSEAEKAFNTATANYNNKVGQIEADATSALKAMPAYPEKGTAGEQLKWSMQANSIEAGKNLKILSLGLSPVQQVLNKTNSKDYKLQKTETRDIPEIRATRNRSF
ncbi:RHS repeat domain-containing protein [Niabella aurantiaca]|uniref:RHS repeat domain-containing protein n=1 Tax=Niabella aurantiaca TaxID=379900 RepID=UPI0003702407|nr:RHS repeat-associated core domain-containing protein [Niabella aurantiaca]